MEELDPKMVARFKRHVMVLALCFAAVVTMKVYMNRQLEQKSDQRATLEPVHDVAVRAHEVEAVLP